MSPEDDKAFSLVFGDPETLETFLTMSTMTRLYFELAVMARRRRVTEHDLRQLEARALSKLVAPPDVAAEVQDFEAEPSFARARQQLELVLGQMRQVRTEKLPGGG